MSATQSKDNALQSFLLVVMKLLVKYLVSYRDLYQVDVHVGFSVIWIGFSRNDDDRLKDVHNGGRRGVRFSRFGFGSDGLWGWGMDEDGDGRDGGYVQRIDGLTLEVAGQGSAGIFPEPSRQGSQGYLLTLPDDM